MTYDKNQHLSLSRLFSGLRTYRLKIFVILLLALLQSQMVSQAYNMRQTFSGDGLSNSAILAMCVDHNGYLWIGTCDGVNIADGTSIHTFQSLFPGRSLSGNIIERIVRGGEHNMWVLTNYALDLIDTESWEIKTFPQFHGQEFMCVDPEGKLYVLSEESRLYLYDPKKDSEFKDLGDLALPFDDVRAITFRNGMLWVLTADSTNLYDSKSFTDSKGDKIKPAKEIKDVSTFFAKAQDEELFIITSEGDLCEIGGDGSSHKIINIAPELATRGKISNLVHDHQGNFFVSFSTDGVLWVGRNEQGEFIPVDLGLHVGIFCLERSSSQDVVWIGTDCQGVYTYWDDDYSIRSYDFNELGNKLSHPVRAIFIDGYKNMWLGTKGDGLLKITNFNEHNPRQSLSAGYLYTSSNSALLHNSVFAFEKSSRPILWIATEMGLNYYNYSDNRLYSVKTEPAVRYIHDMYEQNDSTLWLCTLGDGIARATITGTREHPELKNVKFYTLDDGKRSSNPFFSMTVADDGRLLFCNRGKGMFEIKDDKLTSIPLKTDFGTNLVKDVFAAIDTGDTLWMGTGCGLVKSWQEGERLFRGKEDGFDNNTIHDMILDRTGDIWLSTNAGIVRFNIANNKGETFGRNYGLNVNEYSDGAVFNSGNTIIFGGINGLTFINRHLTYKASEPYVPKLTLLKLSISGEDVPVVDYLESGRGKNKLVLAPDENYFSITVAVPDFIDAHNFVYSYTLDGVNWINNGSETAISFNKMSYGKYDLTVKYMNKVTGMSGEAYSLQIVVNAPWYLSVFAKLIYILLFIGVIMFGVWLYIRYQRRRQKEEMRHLEQAHKEELYEEKLRFFTNITHEFCTPLTLIYGPCERISAYPGSDDYIKRYIGLIRTNAERLNTLIQELIDFRRIETGHKSLKISLVGVSTLCSDIITSFSELADRNNINLINEIEPDIDWATDFSCVRKIMTNLISNAFKYTPTGGTIRISVRKEGEKLRLSVYNTGKGISEEEKQKIFNRYSVLDNVEENAVKGLSARNGLGLAICHSMVDMLQGKIEIESEVGKYADFIVILPALEIPVETMEKQSVQANDKEGDEPADSAGKVNGESLVEKTDEQPLAISNPEVLSRGKSARERVLIVDDNKEILLLLKEALNAYDVIVAETADKALELIRQTPPDLIVSDIMMPGTDGVTFTRMVKQNKHTMHIPLILLSAKTSNEEKVEGIESGADAYIGKPFSLDYLQAVVKRLLENRQYLREYYTTGASVYEYKEGHLLHREDKDFMEKIVAFIEEHVEDGDLGPEKLATHMKISVRNLYRKFKELEQLSPNDFIKYQRISYAARLLVTSSATVQEVIYRSGFTNRSHFYKEFDKRFGMTPKNYRAANASKDLSLDPDEEE